MSELPHDISLPTKLLLDKSVDDNYKIAYAFIRMRAGVNGYVWHHNEALATIIERNIRSIKRALEKLSEHRYLYKDQKATNKALYPGTFKTKDGKETAYWDVVKGKRVIWIYEAWLKANDDVKYKYAKNSAKQPAEVKPTKQDYKKFQNIIRDTYADEIILRANDKYFIAIDVLGKLVTADDSYCIREYLNTDEALRVWRYLYNNPEKMFQPGTKPLRN